MKTENQVTTMSLSFWRTKKNGNDSKRLMFLHLWFCVTGWIFGVCLPGYYEYTSRAPVFAVEIVFAGWVYQTLFKIIKREIGADSRRLSLVGVRIVVSAVCTYGIWDERMMSQRLLPSFYFVVSSRD
jgi:hypothetical protein